MFEPGAPVGIAVGPLRHPRSGYLPVAAAIAGITTGAWIIVASLYVRARLLLGHWPQKNIDDPKDIKLGVHYDMAGVAALSVVIGTALLLVLSIALISRNDVRHQAALYVSLTFFWISTALYVLSPWIPWYLD